MVLHTQRILKICMKISKQKYKLKSMPFLLEDVAGVQELNQADGIHPNKKGHEIMAKNVYEFIKDEL